jgi:hypothetical protein
VVAVSLGKKRIALGRLGATGILPVQGVGQVAKGPSSGQIGNPPHGTDITSSPALRPPVPRAPPARPDAAG